MRPLHTMPFFSKRAMISPICGCQGRREGEGAETVRVVS